MFGLLQPDKVKVGQRIKEIKESMNLSFTELGNRLGIKKPTISSYVQGYALAPESVINQLSSISGKPVGWFYFGDIEEYIADYLQLKGQDRIVQEHPEVVKALKEEFYTGEFKNPAWENEVGYPCEEFIDDYFYELQQDVIKEEIKKLTANEIDHLPFASELSNAKKDEAILVITSSILEYMDIAGEFNYEDKETMRKLVKTEIAKFDFYADQVFDDRYLIGKLINILASDQGTNQLINILSQKLTNKSFTGMFGGEKLIETFQTFRPALIKLYGEVNSDELEDWFEE
ncbi:helix-turn-helix domain-containing protein [Enterococcus faecalis]|uniref:helix-turn-helix domain-containing protein n=1 Tax=Enterococcus faecalis TaxID=1351 RepID=UPI0010BD6423|nr:helix-turn-helix transcriptional regulator [Enterococcus faecalis]MCL4906414.1 helix-turn-helix domain-containing protein [Enterococcus faecalis]MCV3159027.1 helix-turn-helix domain-containing protein [Enterococcus faecalis]MCV3164193.1 helix-turn-helix domain-containing protein [Enterococcus faecalis]MDJ9039350.1 helix-turn-helix domain-containing protein [Enterococcus faecalis]MDK0491617.1 helix-turn-helix domain-containing protein [Enterococcus faecalis]